MCKDYSKVGFPGAEIYTHIQAYFYLHEVSSSVFRTLSQIKMPLQQTTFKNIVAKGEIELFTLSP